MTLLKVTYLTLPHRSGTVANNVGDRIIYHGVRNIMRYAIGEHQEYVSFLSDNDDFHDETDIIVVCGTPQIKYGPPEVMNRILSAAQSPFPLRFNLGAGAFYFDAFEGPLQDNDAAFAQEVINSIGARCYREYGRFDLVTCRDFAGLAVMRQLGIDAIALPCPGFFSSLYQKRPLFRRKEQLISVLNGTATFWNRVKGDVHDFYVRLWESDQSRIFLAHDEQDCLMLSELSIPHVLLEDAEDLLECLAESERLVSLRVHGALPSWSLGLDVTLLGLDRRALLGRDFGAEFRVLPLRTNSDFLSAEKSLETTQLMQGDDIRRAWLMRYLDAYAHAIRQRVQETFGFCFVSDERLYSNSPLGGHIRPELTRRKGLYYECLYYSTAARFNVDLSLLRSHHTSNVNAGVLTVKTDGINRTIVFGPYIRIMAGCWTVTTTLHVAPPSADIRSVNVVASVIKGLPAVLLREVCGAVDCTTSSDFAVSFDNPPDLGMIEIVFRFGEDVPTGTTVTFTELQFSKSD